MQELPTNHRLLLAARPTGIPGPENFAADTVPARAPDAGEVLMETTYLSIDPAMRSWMSEKPLQNKNISLGEVMRGGGIARVIASRAAGIEPGDLVQARLGWQTHPTLNGRYLQKLDLTLGTAEDWIGPLGLSAVTAYFGLRDIGGLRRHDHVLVSSAAGGVGQIAVQIARIEGCRVVGIAGGARKCAFVAEWNKTEMNVAAFCVFVIQRIRGLWLRPRAAVPGHNASGGGVLQRGGQARGESRK